MKERLIHLRIKIKSLAAEAMIIREEAKRTRGLVRHGLNEHRKGTVRHHSRHNLLAYGLLRGMPYELMEETCAEPPSFKKIDTLAKRFGGTDEEIVSWVENAKGYLKKERYQKAS